MGKGINRFDIQYVGILLSRMPDFEELLEVSFVGLLSETFHLPPFQWNSYSYTIQKTRPIPVTY
jgi:hypothetical protein